MKGHLQEYIEKLRAGYTLTEADERRLGRVALSLAMGRKHHKQLRSLSNQGDDDND